MPDEPRYRTLIETPEYSAQFALITKRHSVEVIESTLMGIFWGIATNPEKYDKVTWNIYVAKSHSFNPAIPMLKIFFGIENENEVLLLWIEEMTGTEQME